MGLDKRAKPSTHALIAVSSVSCDRERTLGQASAAQLAELKATVVRLERELLHERTCVTALSEELENPLNIHRWRRLEGSDPTAYELILKVQALQRRLILRTEDAVSKAIVLQEKDKRLVELQNQLARQPGPETVEQLSSQRRALRVKTEQLQAQAAEVNLHRARAEEAAYEVERLNRELTELKRRHFARKKKDELAASAMETLGESALSQGGSALLPLRSIVHGQSGGLRTLAAGYRVG